MAKTAPFEVVSGQRGANIHVSETHHTSFLRQGRGIDSQANCGVAAPILPTNEAVLITLPPTRSPFDSSVGFYQTHA